MRKRPVTERGECGKLAAGRDGEGSMDFSGLGGRLPDGQALFSHSSYFVHAAAAGVGYTMVVRGLYVSVQSAPHTNQRRTMTV